MLKPDIRLELSVLPYCMNFCEIELSEAFRSRNMGMYSHFSLSLSPQVFRASALLSIPRIRPTSDFSLLLD